jgi:hypothetical protein
VVKLRRNLAHVLKDLILGQESLAVLIRKPLKGMSNMERRTIEKNLGVAAEVEARRVVVDIIGDGSIIGTIFPLCRTSRRLYRRIGWEKEEDKREKKRANSVSLITEIHVSILVVVGCGGCWLCCRRWRFLF